MPALAQKVVADIDRQVTAVCNHLASTFPAYREDIQQEAWAAALASATRYQPDDPGASGFFYRVSCLHVAQMINRWIAVPSLSRAAARAGVGAQLQARVAPQDAPVALCGREEAPDGGLARRDVNRQAAALRVLWRRAVEKATADLVPQDVAVGALVHGLDGPCRSVPWVARHLGLWREDVERSAAKYRKALRRRPVVANIEAEIQLLEEGENT